MNDLLLFFVAIGVALSALVQILTDPRITRKFISSSLAALAAFAAHVSIGAYVVFVLLPSGPTAAAGVVTAFIGWLGLGLLGLVRFAPRLREAPAFLLRFGFADALCFSAIVAGVTMALMPSL